MSNIPKNEYKLIKGLSDYLKFALNRPIDYSIINNKNKFYKELPDTNMTYVFGQIFGSGNFEKIAKNLTDEQWNKLIKVSNGKIREKLIKEEKEQKKLSELLSLISTDEFLKDQNISIIEFVQYDKNYYIAKVCLICGTGFIEGSIKEILIQIKEVLKENKINVKIFCSSKNLRFFEEFCLCYDCGAVSLPEKNKVIKILKKEDKNFWGAQVLAQLDTFRK